MAVLYLPVVAIVATRESAVKEELPKYESTMKGMSPLAGELVIRFVPDRVIKWLDSELLLVSIINFD